MMRNLFADKLDLSEFAAASLAEWSSAAEATLKGKPLDKLTTRTPDGLMVEPLYQPENSSFLPGAENDPGIFPYVRGAKATAAWETVQENAADVPAGWVSVDANGIHEQGGSAVQELAFAWGEGLRVLREAEAKGTAIDDAARKIRFIFAAGGEFFVIVAKLRAARYGWAQIVTASGGAEASARMVVHARTSRWQQSSLDPHTNILRSTTSAYAAVIGGCDSLSVAPFDEVFREPDDFSRRIALNTQRILREECHAEAVTDPAGGSWFVENLTKEIADAAWAEFQISEQGQTTNSLAASAESQRDAISKRRRVMVGVNQYANPTEKPLASTKSTCTERLASGFEQLRFNAWDYAAQHGCAPKIFLLTMGPIKQHKARADFARGFFETGGFEVVYPTGFKDAAEAAQAARASGAMAAVLCSTDDTYPELVPAMLQAMMGVLPIILAGCPPDHVDIFKSAGIADFIHVKSDCGAFLAEWQKKLGVSK
jgi:methylmalonyl-CoA mutase